MRRAAAGLLLLCALAAGDWEASHARFKSRYNRNASSVQRKQAILDVADADVPEAAALLLDLWDRLDRETVRRRRELHKVRTKTAALRKKIRTTPASRRDDLRKKLDGLNLQDLKLNAALAAYELEQSAVLDAVGKLASAEAVRWLAENGLARARAPALLRAVAHKVATAREGGIATLLLALDKAKRPDEIIPLLQALASHGPRLAPGIPTLLGHLRHNDWAVRAAAAYALARSGRPEAVGPLVGQIKREKDRSRAQRELARSLAILTGQNFGPHPDFWARWLKANEEKIRSGEIPLGQGKPKAGGKLDQGRFYGIPQEAERIIYVFDKSGSMDVSLKNPQWEGGMPVPAREDEDRRFDAAVREMLRAIRKLRRGTLFAVILYDDHVTALHDELVPATKENIAALEQELARVGPSGSTNIYEAIDHALRLANVHPDGPKGDAKADAVFLISDGSPTTAKGKVEDPDRTIAAIRQWNAHRRVAIHTIGIGRQHATDFMQTIAKENGGEYYAVSGREKK